MSMVAHWQKLFVSVAIFISVLVGPVWLGGVRWEVIPILTVPYISGWLARSFAGNPA